MSVQALRSPSSSGSSEMSLATPIDTTSYSDVSDVSERLVRFDERCVLIPEPSSKYYKSGRHPPRIVTNTLDFSLPIPTTLPWRWPGATQKGKEPNNTGSQQESNTVTKQVSKSHEAQHVVLKVPYPIFRRKSTSSVPSTSALPRQPCLVYRNNGSVTSTTSLSPVSPSCPIPASSPVANTAHRKPRRSTSLPPLSPEQGLETIPLRPCCKNCIAACESELHQRIYTSTLPPLKESSREQTPNASQLHLPQVTGVDVSKAVGTSNEEDWCSGLHFTKGALRLRRASLDHDRNSPNNNTGEGLLGALVRVDEIDCKRGVNSSESTREKPKPTPLLNLKNLSHLHDTSIQKKEGNGNNSPTACSEEDLFPLPSPKRSPASSPADSSTYLPSTQVLPSSEPRKLEAAIKAKMAEREKARSLSSSPLPSPIATTSPIPIKSVTSKTSISRFKPHTDDIVYDQSLPDPDALPLDSTILLNSPPTSPQLLSEVSKHESLSSDPLSLSPPTEILLSTSPPNRPTARRASLSNVMRAGAGILRGISVSVPTQNPTYTGGVVI